jgi:hypothetical protein
MTNRATPHSIIGMNLETPMECRHRETDNLPTQMPTLSWMAHDWHTSKPCTLNSLSVSPLLAEAHNLKVAGSNPAPATNLSLLNH